MRAVTLLLALTSVLLSAAEDPTLLDAETAATLAATAHERSTAADAQVLAAEERAHQATSFLRPHLNANASAGIAGGTRNPDYDRGTGDRSRYTAGAEIDQYLLGFGRVGAARTGAQALIGGAQAGRTLTRRDLAFRARIAVTDVLFAREVTAIAEARVTQRSAERKDSQQRLDAGLAAIYDVQQGDISVANAEEDLLASQTRLMTARILLADTVNQPHGSVDAAGALVRPADLDVLLEQAATAASGGADLARLNALRQTAEAEARLAHADAWPTISGFAGGDVVDDAIDGPFDDGWSAGLRLSWTLYDGGLRYDQAGVARAEAAAARAEAAAVTRERRSEAVVLRIRAADLDLRIALKRTVIELAEKNYANLREKYAAGLETLTRINEANLQVFEARFALASLTRDELNLAHEARRLAE